jgi:hypothetical protein
MEPVQGGGLRANTLTYSRTHILGRKGLLPVKDYHTRAPSKSSQCCNLGQIRLLKGVKNVSHQEEANRIRFT